MRRLIYLRFCGATYLRRSQRYEKSSAEANACLILPRRSIYGASQSTKSRAQKQTHVCFCRDGVSSAQSKIRKVERRSKRMFDSAETEYLRRKPKYEKSSAEANACLFLSRRSIYGAAKVRKVERRSKRMFDSVGAKCLRCSRREVFSATRSLRSSEMASEWHSLWIYAPCNF